MKLADLADIESPEDFTFTYKGRKVTYLDEAGVVSDYSHFFVAGFEHGAHVLIHVESYRGDGFESAWEAWIDSLPTIPESELVEAYGTKDGSFIDMAHAESRGDNVPYMSDAWNEKITKIHARAKEMLDTAAQAARDGSVDYPELIEGYALQSNVRGTGIVSMGHYAWMNETDLGDVEVTRN